MQKILPLLLLFIFFQPVQAQEVFHFRQGVEYLGYSTANGQISRFSFDTSLRAPEFLGAGQTPLWLSGRPKPSVQCPHPVLNDIYFPHYFVSLGFEESTDSLAVYEGNKIIQIPKKLTKGQIINGQILVSDFQPDSFHHISDSLYSLVKVSGQTPVPGFKPALLSKKYGWLSLGSFADFKVLGIYSEKGYEGEPIPQLSDFFPEKVGDIKSWEFEKSPYSSNTTTGRTDSILQIQINLGHYEWEMQQQRFDSSGTISPAQMASMRLPGCHEMDSFLQPQHFGKYMMPSLIGVFDSFSQYQNTFTCTFNETTGEYLLEIHDHCYKENQQGCFSYFMYGNQFIYSSKRGFLQETRNMHYPNTWRLTGMRGSTHYGQILSSEKLNSISAKVYPNPAGKTLYLSFPDDASGWKYTISDISGKLYLTGNYSGNIEVATLPSGLHYLQLNNGSETFRIPFIKD